MKTRSFATLSLAAIAILAATSGVSAAAAEPEAKKTATATAGKAEPAAQDDATKGKLVLTKGLEAEAILKGYGKLEVAKQWMGQEEKYD